MNNTSIMELFAAGSTAIIVGGVIWWVLQIIAYWKIFTKAEEEGWKSIIPIYSNYVQYKIVWKPSMFWIGVIASIASGITYILGIQSASMLLFLVAGIFVIIEIVITIIFYNKMAKAFGKDIGFTLGLIILNPIFILILGYGNAEYIGNFDMNKKEKRFNIRTMTMTAMLSAVSFILMLLDFSVPIMPGFVKMDLSELPALIGAFSMGPVSGMMICLIKNVFHLAVSSTGGVGELSNFILGAAFVVPAGLIYTYKKTRSGALIGSLTGAVIMAVISVFTNYYITYPVYTAFMPMEAILNAYQAINPNVKTLWDALIWFNMPFNFIKSVCSVLITLLVYKRISPLIKGTRVQLEKK